MNSQYFVPAGDILEGSSLWHTYPHKYIITVRNDQGKIIRFELDLEKMAEDLKEELHTNKDSTD